MDKYNQEIALIVHDTIQENDILSNSLRKIDLKPLL